MQEEMFVDSGSLYTMVSAPVWYRLRKNEQFQIKRYIENPKVNFLDGSGEVRYTVRHTALVGIHCNGRYRETEVVVVNENLPMLLGREDAKALGVLRVGLNAANPNITVQAISTEKLAPLSKFKDFQLRIPIDPNVTLVMQPISRVPYGLRSTVEDNINELLELDVIEKVSGASAWVSPIVLVPKSNETYRICVDMRRANEAVLNEKHPMTSIEDVEPQLKDATVFSKIDLRQAYHQIELDEKSHEITTFWTHMGLFRYKRLVEGLKCAPEMFQRILENVLTGLTGVFNYLDDLLVYGSDQKDHDANLKAVLHRLREHGLEINHEKSCFAKSEVTFIGHVISKGIIKPMLDKVKSIREFRFPESAEELRSFLGLVSYVGKLIPHLLTELDVLRRVARTTPFEFEWSPEAVQYFIHIQTLLSKKSHLYLFDPELPTIAMADASPIGLGAVLLQKKGEATRVICYVSRSLTPVERRYSQSEKEALALVFAVERLKYYLLGQSFELVTDHKPLETIFGNRSKPCARLERWLLRLQGFKYTIRYAPGENNIADPLSRLLEVENRKSLSTVNETYEQNLVSYVTHLVPRAVTL